VPELAPKPVAGDRRTDSATDDESGPSRTCPGMGGDMYDKSVRTDPTPVTNRRDEVLATAHSTLNRQHRGRCP
jgi:hypothetical protein